MVSPNELLRAAAVGGLATLFMDLWNLFLKRAFGIPSLDLRLLGRWLLHMPGGTFRHPKISAAAAKPGERALGLAAHYSIGVVFALLLAVLTGGEWLRRPTLLPALACGVATVVFPLFLMQPAFGLGLASARTPHPARARLKSLATHTVFGFGLYLAAAAFASPRPSPDSTDASSGGLSPRAEAGETHTMQIDHILLGAADLDRAVADFRERTGVEARFGGKHPFGTHNALASLGDGVYLELIAPQPGATPDDWLKELLTIEGLRPFGWALGAPDPDAARRELAAAGLPVTPSQPGSRATPDGTTLRWETFTLERELAGAPFFITWGEGVPHPSSTSPAGCRLESFAVRGPDVEGLRRLASRVRQKVVVEQAEKPGYTVALRCPKGTVTFDAR